MAKISAYPILPITSLTGEEYTILSHAPASPLSLTATTISMQASDNSINFAASNAPAFKVGQTIQVTGSATVDGQHEVVSRTASKVVIDFDITADESAGSSITVEQIDSNYRHLIHYPVAFYAKRTTEQSNITGNNVEGTVICDSETYDYGSCYNTSTGLFTAPFDGIYSFTASGAVINGSTSGLLYARIKNTTSGLVVVKRWEGAAATTTWATFSGSLLVLSGQSVSFTVQFTAGTQTADVAGDNTSPIPPTHFSGYLVTRV